MDVSKLTYFDKIYLLWKYDSSFSFMIICSGFSLVLLFLILFVFGVNWFSVIWPGGRVFGDSMTTAFPRKIPIITFIIGLMLYISFKVDNTLFIEDDSSGIICEYKSDFLHNLVTAKVLDIDKYFFLLIFVFAMIVIPVVYIIWFKE